MSNSRSVLILTTDRQIDRRILQEADSLERAGWQITILAASLDVYEQDDDPRVVRLNKLSQNVERHNFPLRVYRKIRRYLPSNHRWLQYLKRWARAYWINLESFYLNLFGESLFQYSPQVVVGADLPMLPAAVKLAKHCGAKLVYDSHELYSEQEFSKLEKKRWGIIENKYIHHCDAVITVNPSIASELERRYGLRDVSVIYNAVSPDVTTTQEIKPRLFHHIFSLSPEKKILLFQGGLSPNRHLDVLVHAMSRIKNPSVDLIVLGDGLLREKLEQLAIESNIKHRIHFHAAVPQEQLLSYTQSADVGIIPYQATSLNNYYCTPNKLFEFIAAGIPILASDLPEIKRLITTYDVGLTGKMSKPQDLAELIETCFADSENLMTWKKNSLIAQKHVNWEQEEKKLLKIFAPFE